MTEKLVLSIYLMSLVVAGTAMTVGENYTGELKHFRLGVSSFEVFLLFFLIGVGFFLTYFFYIYTKNKKFYLTRSRWHINLRRLCFFYLFLLVINLIFFINTGVGLAGGNKTNHFSFILSPLNVGIIFPIFYILCRKSNVSKILFWLNVLLFTVLNLLKGWTGFLFLIAILEMYFFLQSRKFCSASRVIIILLVPALFFLVGGKIYQYLYPYKFQVRGIGVVEVNYDEAVMHLVDRMNFFPIAVGAYEKNKKINELYFQDGVEYKEIQGLFRPLAPRFLMPHKEFRSLNNNSKQAFVLDLSDKTSNDIGFIMYGITLFSIDMLGGAAWLVLSVVLIFIVKFTLDSLEQFRGQFNVLYFLLLLKLYQTASLEVVFGNGYLYLVYILPVFYLLGVIKLKRVKTL